MTEAQDVSQDPRMRLFLPWPRPDKHLEAGIDYDYSEMEKARHHLIGSHMTAGGNCQHAGGEAVWESLGRMLSHDSGRWGLFWDSTGRLQSNGPLSRLLCIFGK